MITVPKITYDKYPAYKDSGVEWMGEIPEHWELTRLGSYFEERKTKVSDKDYPPLSVTKQGILPQLDSAAKTNDGDNRKLVKKGDFVINSRSDRKGSSGIAYEDGSVSLINIVMKPISIHPIFCNYLLKSNAFVEENYRIGRGIVADLWTTRYDEMKNIKIGVPFFEEQTAIAEFLDEKTEKIDRAIAQKEKMMALLKERKQIIIQDLVTGKKVWNAEKNTWTTPEKTKDSGVEWIGKIPEEWEVKRLKYVLREPLKYGANESGIEYSPELPRYIRISDFTLEGKLNENKKLSLPWEIGKDFLLDDGDILFARSGATVGKSYQFRKSMSIEENYSYAGYLIKASPNQEVIMSDFLYYFTMSKSFDNWKNLIFNKATIENIGADKYSEVNVVITSIQEQSLIVSYIENQSAKIDKAIDLQAQQIEKLKELKSTLIDSAVTGKLRVPALQEIKVSDYAE